MSHSPIKRKLRTSVLAYELFTAYLCSAIAFMGAIPAAASATDVMARVRADHVVRCATIVRAGLAVPTLDGTHWRGLAVDMCRAVAAAVLGDPTRISLRPYIGNGIASLHRPDDLVFLSSTQLIGDNARGNDALHLGPTVFHDALGLLVPAMGAATIAELSRKVVCVEAGSPADRALTQYFDQHHLDLHEHPFQETDEMRQAYDAGNCDALAGPLTTLASVRADPSEGRHTDRILSQVLVDQPILAATPGDARWSQIVWWTFSALVDAEADGISGAQLDINAAIPGVPPAVGRDLGLSREWQHDALVAGGNYGEVYDRNLGDQTGYRLSRDANRLYVDGGLITALSVE
jgi:general L-amino acid transport system substrate-binding protein